MLPFCQLIKTRSHVVLSPQYFKSWFESWFELVVNNNHSKDFTNNKCIALEWCQSTESIWEEPEGVEHFSEQLWGVRNNQWDGFHGQRPLCLPLPVDNKEMVNQGMTIISVMFVCVMSKSCEENEFTDESMFYHTVQQLNCLRHEDLNWYGKH